MAVGMSRPGRTHAAAVRAIDDAASTSPVIGGDPATGLDPDDLPDGLVVADESGRVICFNRAAVRITATPGPPPSAVPWNTRCPSRTSRAGAGGT